MKKKIMFVITSLVGGGAEKVLTDILGFLDYSRYDVILVLFEMKGVYLDIVPEDVSVISLKKRNKFSIFNMIIKLSRLYVSEKPDIVISFMNYTYLIVFLAKILSFQKFALIATIHIDISETKKYLRKARYRDPLYKISFKFADCLVVPSKGVYDDILNNYSGKSQKVLMIHHPLDLELVSKKANEFPINLPSENYILAVGRLTHQKGFEDLIDAYSYISNDINESLLILGEGEDKIKLKEKINSLNLQDRVFLLGYQKNVYKYMKNASLFVLSSLWESFAVVLIEAMACGVPIISTNCPSGPEEIISDGLTGSLVPVSRPDILAKTIKSLLNDLFKRQKYQKNGYKRVQDFDVKKIVSKYDDLFMEYL